MYPPHISIWCGDMVVECLCQGQSTCWIIIGALRRILNLHWSELVNNDEIRSSTALGSHTVRSRHLSSEHLHCADPRQDHHRALQACISGPTCQLETEDRLSKAILA